MAELRTPPGAPGLPLRFDDQVAIVTGAGSPVGLGREYARLLARRGAKVLVNDYGVEPDGKGSVGGAAEAVAREIRDEGGAAASNDGSVASRTDCIELVEQAMDLWGRVDVVINNAGIAPFARFMEISDEDIERVIGVHLMGHIWMCRAAWPHMVRQEYGRVVNVSSAVALRGMLFQSVYSAAKLGIVGLTRALASEGVGRGINVNALMPAADTSAWQSLLEPGFSEHARDEGIVAGVVAPVAAFLSHSSCEFSGKTLNARAGAMEEIVFARTKGTPADSELTLEDVAERIPTVLDQGRFEVFADPDGPLPPGIKPKPYGVRPASEGAR